MKRHGIVVVGLLLASACSRGTETTAPASSTTTAVPATGSTTTIQAPTTTTTPPTTTSPPTTTTPPTVAVITTAPTTTAPTTTAPTTTAPTTTTIAHEPFEAAPADWAWGGVEARFDPGKVFEDQSWGGYIVSFGWTPGEEVWVIPCKASYDDFDLANCDYEDRKPKIIDDDGFVPNYHWHPGTVIMFWGPRGWGHGDCVLYSNRGPDGEFWSGDEKEVVLCDSGTGEPPARPEAPTTAAPTTTAATTTTPPLTTSVAPTTTTTANINWIPELLAPLVVSSASAPIDYDRDDWGSGWSDDNSDCINTRHEVLILESLTGTGLSSSGCSVVSGQWYAAFTGTYVTNPSSLDVDHFVPLANAHDSGGWAWSSATKRSYYNDLVDPQHLIAVTASANRSKGSRGPEEWKPSDSSYWCQYADSWVDIKVRWALTVTSAELSTLQSMLGTCDGPPDGVYVPPAAPSTTTSTTTSTRTTTSTTTTTTVVTNPGNTKNCSDFSTYPAAKAWFDTYFPYYGDVARLDGDNDGEPCESLPGGS